MLDTGRIGALVKGANLLLHGAVRAGDALMVAQMFDPGGLEPGLDKAGGAGDRTCADSTQQNAVKRRPASEHITRNQRQHRPISAGKDKKGARPDKRRLEWMASHGL